MKAEDLLSTPGTGSHTLDRCAKMCAKSYTVQHLSNINL